MTPLIAHTMDWARSQIAAPSRQVIDQTKADAAMIARLVRGPDGPALMDLMARLTVLRPALDPRLAGSASHDFAQRRVGENNVFNAFVHLLDTHDLLQTKETPHETADPNLRPVFGWWDGAPLGDAGRPDPASGDAAGGRAGSFEFDPGGTIAAG